MRIRALTAAVALLTTLTLSLAGGAAAAPAHGSAHGSDGGRFDRPSAGFAPAGTVLRPGSPGDAGLDAAPIDAFEQQMAGWEDPSAGAGYLFPGATTLMAHDGVVVERSAGGFAVKYADTTTELPPDQWIPARTDTIYDLASLSKLFTSIVAMQQLAAGRIALDTPVAHYLPEFATNGKGDITIRELLTHTSGFDADPVPSLWQGYPDIASREKAILDAKPINPPGTTYLYSDLNMLSMQLVLEEVTGKPLDTLVREGITAPLHLTDTGYNPPASKLPRIAATEYQTSPDRGMVRGQVHDENAWALGGVAGHAGVFSTVDDLAVLAQTILNGGTYRGHRILSGDSVRLMEENFNQAFPGDSHGLGFELDQIWYMGGLSGPQTLGHTGFTGTSLVIDPQSRSFVILLSNRVHPTRNTPSTNPPRRAIGEAMSQAMRVSAPGGGPLWYSGQGGGTTSTLTTGPLTASAPVDVDFSTFVNTESTDLLTVEDSTDGGATWQALPLTVTGEGAPPGTPTSLSGQAVRAWWHVHASVPQQAGAFRIRWRYTTDPVYEGRGVDLAHLSVTSGHPVPGSGDLTATGGWKFLPDGR
ncbi:CubicO group peptidase, beta-lactamase class C family [Actinacidiphila yanglinensis]|uniref:CubicO group peptidase, beta-lactamase class C family n=1 Tax=Actinacidiphila yanglinensis TaxID=310779 RepID=A0A1H6E3S6_9ACTN|nr:serine hydrolase domain-containing protein [Actinacidiphila yanglinensis]SEG92348.1 CubicO group peptidase, beta-lactamase class C family [Actinacidiphila yanglinensis]